MGEGPVCGGGGLKLLTMFLLSREGLSLGGLFRGLGFGHFQGCAILAGGSLDECFLSVDDHG